MAKRKELGSINNYFAKANAAGNGGPPGKKQKTGKDVEDAVTGTDQSINLHIQNKVSLIHSSFLTPTQTLQPQRLAQEAQGSPLILPASASSATSACALRSPSPLGHIADWSTLNTNLATRSVP